MSRDSRFFTVLWACGLAVCAVASAAVSDRPAYNGKLDLFPADLQCECDWFDDPLVAAQDASADVSGDWRMSWQGKVQAKQAPLHIEQAGSKLTGTISGKPIAGSVDGERISFSFESHPGTTVVFNGAVHGDMMNGEASDGRTWSASR